MMHGEYNVKFFKNILFLMETQGVLLCLQKCFIERYHGPFQASLILLDES